MLLRSSYAKAACKYVGEIDSRRVLNIGKPNRKMIHELPTLTNGLDNRQSEKISFGYFSFYFIDGR